MAREDFYTRIRKQLLSILRGKFPYLPETDRQDLAQDAVMRILGLLESGKRQEQDITRYYLAKTAHSVYCDFIKKHRLEDQMADGFDGADEDRPSPAAQAQGKELGQAIHECLKELQEDRKRVVTLWLQGNSMKEIDRLIEGRSYRSLEGLLCRGREELRHKLRERGFGPLEKETSTIASRRTSRPGARAPTSSVRFSSA